MKLSPHSSVLLSLILGFSSAGCRADEAPVLGKAADNKIYAQQLVNELMAAHSELVVVGLHATAPGSKQETMIASNLDRIGKKDDDDDIAVANEHKTILAPNLKEPEKFEIQVPLKDKNGQYIGAAAGLVFKYHAGDDLVGLLVKALAIQSYLASHTESVAALLAPRP